VVLVVLEVLLVEVVLEVLLVEVLLVLLLVERGRHHRDRLL
jgi:hypothetical protein